MKTRISLFITLVLSILSAVPGAAEETGSNIKAYLVYDDTPEVLEVRKLGENAINRLASTMVREVNRAIAKYGTDDAIETCHLKDVEIINGTIAGMPRITAMKRTSLKLRDRANAPDAADLQALDAIKKLLDNGDQPPSLLVQRFEPLNATPEWRVYKPLGMLPACLSCHGDTAMQSDLMKAKLHALYPTDQAVGYSVGAWRGLIRVTVADAPRK